MDPTSAKHTVETASSVLDWILRIPSAKGQWSLTKASPQPQALHPAWVPNILL